MGCGGSKSDTTTSQQGGGGGGNQGKQQGKQGQGKGQGQGRGGGGKGGKGGSQNRGNSGTKKNTGPITEKGYKKRIRENLRDASAGNDIEYLEKCMEVFQNNHLEDGGDYEEAERRLEYLLLKKEIRDACMRNHPVVLEKAIEKVKASPYQRQLKAYLDRANYLKQHQDELDTFRHDISDLDQACVSEVRSYKYPPVGVHETMVATYLVLGHKENSLLKDWSEVAALMGHYGKDNLVREVANADPKSVSNETALRARHYLSRYSLDEIRAVSNGAAAFHVWASKMAGYDGKNKGGSGGGGDANQTKHLTNSSTNKSQANKSPSKPATPGQANKTDNKNSAAGKDKGKEKKDEKQQVNTAKQQQNTTPKPNTNTATKDSKTNTNTTTKNNNNTANTAKNTQNKPAPTNTANAKQTTANAKQTTSKKG